MPSPISRTISVRSSLLVASLLTVSTFSLLLWSGALRTELSAASDEPAHYVTGLMIRGYLEGGLGTSPREFAERFYLHYPKVAFGVWPPLFHLSLGAWMFVVGASPASALVFIGLTTVAVGFVIFRVAQPRLGTPLAAAVALWFIMLPSVQISTASVMMDMLCALLTVCAAVAFGRYLESTRTRDVALFAVLSSAAIMTKYNGLALALVPPLAIALTRRWELWKRPNLWLAPGLVAALCGPWYVAHRDLVRYASEPFRTLVPWTTASLENTIALVMEPGPIAVPLVVLGVWSRASHKRADSGLWASLLALVAAVWLFHSLVYPTAGVRYFIPTFAALVLFAGAGVHRLMAAATPPAAVSWWPAVVHVATVVVLALAVFHVPVKASRGFADAADAALMTGVDKDSTLLVSSDPIGEGAFIAHVASRELQPRTIVLRASKLLASSTWMYARYSVKHPDEPTLARALDEARVEYVALDDGSQERHHRQLASLVERSARWRQVAQFWAPHATQPVRLYRRVDRLPPSSPRFEIDLRHSIGVTLRP